MVVGEMVAEGFFEFFEFGSSGLELAHGVKLGEINYKVREVGVTLIIVNGRVLIFIRSNKYLKFID
jgi:hypothetical protein